MNKLYPPTTDPQKLLTDLLEQQPGTVFEIRDASDLQLKVAAALLKNVIKLQQGNDTTYRFIHIESDTAKKTLYICYGIPAK